MYNYRWLQALRSFTSYGRIASRTTHEKQLSGNVKQLSGNVKQVSAIVVGAGSRGQDYAVFAKDNPGRFQIVGVVAPREFKREQFRKSYDIAENNVFSSWEEAASREKMADCALVCTPDRLHKDPAIAFAKKGYHILLEKPMAVSFEDCKEIVKTCKENKVLLSVCHVLRYTPQAKKIKEIIESGAIGEVMNIQLFEPVGYWHFAHSYVRGNWNNSGTSTFILLTKSCHDIDLISYWMDKKCTSISSFGSLKHFNKENKPEDAADRCLDCNVERSCPYSAKKIYLDKVDQGDYSWPVSVITEVLDIENLTLALKEGPYGKCVYDSDNDVMDNQVVNMQFEGGATVQFSMVACTNKVCERQVKIFGTKGELSCDFAGMDVEHIDFLEGRHKNYDLHEYMEAAMTSNLQGHGGADYFTMDAFVQAVATGDASKILSGPVETLTSHYLCFMAEKSRRDKTVINL